MTFKRSLYLVLALILGWITSSYVFSQESTVHFEVITPAYPEKLDYLQIEEIMGADSKKDVLANGYLASKHVTCLFGDLGYRYTGGENYKNDLVRFRLRVPPSYLKDPKTDKKFPLVIWFHGMGESGRDNERQLAHMHHALSILTGPKELDFFILAPQCSREDQYWSTPSTRQVDIEDSPIAIVEEITDMLIKDFPVDKERISLVGFCSGTFGVHRMMIDRPDLISAAVFISRGLPDDQYDNLILDINLWFFYGVHDNSVKQEAIAKYVDSVTQQGGSAKITTCDREPGDQHNSWKAAFTKYRVLEWMIEQRRTK